jgi:hydrogenase expression/formation protein HypE
MKGFAELAGLRIGHPVVPMAAASQTLPVGKLSPELLAVILAHFATNDAQIVVGPGIGIDCAVVRVGKQLLVFKSDPITFTSKQLGHYLVHVNANDIATTGARPRWLLLTMLMPEKHTTTRAVMRIADDVEAACREIGVAVIGGHSEVTHGLRRPLLIGTMIGDVEEKQLITPHGARPGHRILLTKGVPIEATAILAREFPERIRRKLGAAALREARSYLFNPGIGVLHDAQSAIAAGKVSAMHDPTEGGLVMALWELAEASDCAIVFDPTAVPVPPVAAAICRLFDLDPLAAIASGALLITAPQQDALHIRRALKKSGINSADIGHVDNGPPAVWRTVPGGCKPVARPKRDEIARIFGQSSRSRRLRSHH